MLKLNEIHCGNSLDLLKQLDDKSIHCCVTSPPYLGLRKYLKDGDENANLEIGLENSLQDYLDNLVKIFAEVHRVLRDDGSFWLNIGDSYNAGRNGGHAGGKSGVSRTDIGPQKSGLNINGLKPKELCGVPWRLAFALQQPYILPTCVKSDVDRSWLAAAIDGEGSIGIRRFDSYREDQIYQDGFVIYTSISNNDIEFLEKCVQITGYKHLYIKNKAGSVNKNGIIANRDTFTWRLDGNKAVNVIQSVYPFLTIKKKQAILCYTLDRLNKMGHGSKSVPAEIQEKKKYLWELVKKCNQREANIDLPNWVEEPNPIVVHNGWYLRRDIIWAKGVSFNEKFSGSCMPESCKDRPTTSHEYLFLLTKSPKYFYDKIAVEEDGVWPAGTKAAKGSGNREGNRRADDYAIYSGKRNLRSVWTIPVKPYKKAHFATYPEKLVEPCVKAGTSERGCCSVCGNPYTRLVNKKRIMRHELPIDDPNYRPGRYTVKSGGLDDYAKGGGQAFSHSEMLGWEKTCKCENSEIIPCVVLDPFGGSGTTGGVAKKLNRNYLLFELNPEYCKIGQERLDEILL